MVARTGKVVAFSARVAVNKRGVSRMAKNKKAFDYSKASFDKDRQRLTLPGVILVPSALAGLTSLFGMGRGDPRRYSHLKILRGLVHFTGFSDQVF
jgi:hypothetical protein